MNLSLKKITTVIVVDGGWVEGIDWQGTGGNFMG